MTSQTDNLKSAFLYYRRRGSIAIAAIQRARQDIAANVSRYPRAIATGAQVWAPMANGMQWCNPDQIGLRFVGWQDELREGRAANHKGWYTFPDGDTGEVLRGCVYQLTGRDGKARYLPGYREGSDSRKGWSDTCGEHNAAIHFGDAFSYTDADDAKRDAARAADQFAETAAEKQREWQEVWQQGRQYADLGEEVTSHRRDALALIREIKAAGQFTPAICATLRAHVESHLRDIRTARAKRAELIEGVWDKYRAAFDDGAGIFKRA